MECQPTGLMLASTNVEAAQAARHLFSSEHARVYLTKDVIGVEIGGALKNIFASMFF
jgi:glycerol-3-phosphate dehydrogenase (NAD(P)+)